jgi:undecaprenyl pyrophosphate phosphatase UppP
MMRRRWQFGIASLMALQAGLSVLMSIYLSLGTTATVVVVFYATILPLIIGGTIWHARNFQRADEFRRWFIGLIVLAVLVCAGLGFFLQLMGHR